MKTYGRIIIFTVLCTFSSCSTHRSISSRKVSNRQDHSERELSLQVRDSSSTTTTAAVNEKSITKKYRLEFDTSRPINPITGLHPISAIEVEGSELDKITSSSSSIESSAELQIRETQTSDNTNEETEDQTTTKEIVNETKPILSRFIALGIVVLLIIIAITIYKYVRSHTQQ